MCCVFHCSVPLEPEAIKEYADVTLNDLVRVETLGMGGFGRVELVSPLLLRGSC